MNRRGFLQLLGATAAMAATGLTLEELLAPERTIFLPSPQIIVPAQGIIGHYEGLQFIPQLWLDEMLQAYKNNLILSNVIMRKYNLGTRLANTGSYNIFEDRVRLYTRAL
jgi:hypothetical protein